MIATFSANGAALLSAASATKTLEIDHIYCIESEVSQSDLLSQPKSYFESLSSAKLTASVTSVGDDPNKPGYSRCIIEIGLTDLADSDVTVKTVVVTAHSVDSGIDGGEGTFYGITDSTGIVVPYSTTIPVKQQIAFSYAFTEQSTITIDGNTTNFLMESEVGRFVSTHKAGQPTQGDDQVVYGEKSFKNDIHVSQINSNSNDNTICITADVYGDDHYNLGVDIMPWGTTYTDIVVTQRIEADDDGEIELASDLYPSGAGVNLGTGARPFSGVTANAGAFSGVVCGTLSAELGTITLNDSIVPYDTACNLGADDAPFGNVYAEKINGVIPDVHTRTGGTPGTDNPIIPVGALVMINLVNSDSSNFASGANAVAGEIVSSSGGELADGTAYDAITVAQYERGSALSIKTEYTTNISRGVLSTGMNFRVICGCHNTTAANMITVLAMRLADSI